MKSISIFICFLLFLFFLMPVYVSADEFTENLVSKVIESFDPDTKASDWLVRGSKFSTENYPKQLFTTAWPEALYGANSEGVDYQVLGFNSAFDRQGYNSIEIIPIETIDGNMEENPLPLPGRVKYLDVWVWGSDYDYYAEVHIRDFNGVVHVLNLGTLNYTGWKNLRVSIPSYIPQGTYYAPFLKTLELVKFVIWTRPTENVANNFCYVDQVKILTDIFITRFDGDNLTRPDVMDDIWASAESR